MRLSEYQILASRTINRNHHPDDMANHGLGLAGESGEVIEHIKKHCYHGKPLNADDLLEELGDVLWYVAAIATTAGLSLDQIGDHNINKLKKRYPKGFQLGEVGRE